VTSRTLKLLCGLRVSHLEHENSEGFVVGDNLVWVTWLPTPTLRAGQVTGALWTSSFFTWEIGREISPAHFP
jgi:hypothetical protein